ncbi:MAG TPA: DUF86 domain-containing protein [Anaerolineaceae bacterium]
MTRRDPSIAINQILEHAREAVEICHGKTRADLDSDRLLNLALTRLIEIIGEAANRVPESTRVKYPELPWMQMVGARNRLIHGYDSVDLNIMWAIVTNDLPVMIKQIETIMGQKS